MADPDTDPNAWPDDLEDDAHQPPAAPGLRASSPYPPVPLTPQNLTGSKQTPRPDIPIRADANPATPHSPPAPGPAPHPTP